MDVTKVPPLPSGSRPETGPMQFGDDWPGVFIRGDNALYDAHVLAAAITKLPEEMWLERSVLEGLVSTLRSCAVR